MAQNPQVAIPAPANPRVRQDVNVPVMTFQTETDVTLLGYAGSRQDDSDRFRLWEVAGTAHPDYYTIVTGRADATGEPQFAAAVEVDSVQGILSCDRPTNAGPPHYVFKRAIRALDEWVNLGTLPSQAPRLDLSDDGTAFLFDDLGNVTGGVRTPYVDAPGAILSGEGQTVESFCFLFSSTELLDAATMASLYVDPAGYVAAVTDAANAAVDAGFLLQEDAESIITWAPQQWDSQVGP